METPDPDVNAPEQVQKFLGKVKEFIESNGGKIGKIVAINSGPTVPRLIYHHEAHGAVLGVQDCRLKEYVHGRFGNN